TYQQIFSHRNSCRTDPKYEAQKTSSGFVPAASTRSGLRLSVLGPSKRPFTETSGTIRTDGANCAGQLRAGIHKRSPNIAGKVSTTRWRRKVGRAAVPPFAVGPGRRCADLADAKLTA